MNKIIQGCVYKITCLKNNKIYIGVSFSKKSTYLDRFQKHLQGKGSVWIKKDLESKCVTKNDFVVEVLETSNDVGFLKQKEIEYIKKFNSLYPNGYNGNLGNYIVLTDEQKSSALKKRQEKIKNGLINLKGKGKGQAVYRYHNGEIAKLPTNHPDVLTKKCIHVNCKIDQQNQKEKLKFQNDIEKYIFGYTLKQLTIFKKQKEKMKTVHLTESWKIGRNTFRNRIQSKGFTTNEKREHLQRSKRVKNIWSNRNNDEKQNIVKKGLSIMNSVENKKTCEICKKTVSLGNYFRWHGQNCRQKPNSKDQNVN